MKFVKNGDIYKVIRITGPAHNLLGLVFTEVDLKEDKIEVIPLASGISEAPSLNGNVIKSQVILGMKEINSQLNTNYKLKKILFSPTDTPIPEIYKSLAKEIVTKIHNGYKFN